MIGLLRLAGVVGCALWCLLAFAAPLSAQTIVVATVVNEQGTPIPQPTKGPVGTSVPTASPPVAPSGVMTSTGCGTVDNPCFVSSTMVLPDLDEGRAGAILGCMIIYGILWLFLRAEARIVIGFALGVAIVLSVFSGLYVYLYGWLLFIVCVVALDKLRGVVFRDEVWNK